MHLTQMSGLDQTPFFLSRNTNHNQFLKCAICHSYVSYKWLCWDAQRVSLCYLVPRAACRKKGLEFLGPSGVSNYMFAAPTLRSLRDYPFFKTNHHNVLTPISPVSHIPDNHLSKKVRMYVFTCLSVGQPLLAVIPQNYISVTKTDP